MPDEDDNTRVAMKPEQRVPVTELLNARKAVASKATELQSAVNDVVQLSLIDEVEFEEGVLLEGEELRKRYTAENARQIEWRRKACIRLLALQCPAEDIADILSMNHRTVQAVAAQEGQKIAAFGRQHAEVLSSSAMADIALAQTKRSSASFKDLHIAAGIKLTHAANINLGASAAEPDAIDVEGENPQLAKAREFLLKRKATEEPINVPVEQPSNEGTKL